MAEGDRVALVYPSANRDEAVFHDPDEVDLRRDPNPHIAFGFATHFCLGAHVARLVLRVALEELTARFTHLRAAADPVYEANVFVKAVERFEMGFDRAMRTRLGIQGGRRASVAALLACGLAVASAPARASTTAEAPPSTILPTLPPEVEPLTAAVSPVVWQACRSVGLAVGADGGRRRAGRRSPRRRGPAQRHDRHAFGTRAHPLLRGVPADPAPGRAAGLRRRRGRSRPSPRSATRSCSRDCWPTSCGRLDAALDLAACRSRARSDRPPMTSWPAPTAGTLSDGPGPRTPRHRPLRRTGEPGRRGRRVRRGWPPGAVGPPGPGRRRLGARAPRAAGRSSREHVHLRRGRARVALLALAGLALGDLGARRAGPTRVAVAPPSDGPA